MRVNPHVINCTLVSSDGSLDVRDGDIFGIQLPPTNESRVGFYFANDSTSNLSISTNYVFNTQQIDNGIIILDENITTDQALPLVYFDIEPADNGEDSNLKQILEQIAIAVVVLVVLVILFIIILIAAIIINYTRNKKKESKSERKKLNQEMKDVATDDFQASDVLSPDYNYITEDEVVTNTNEAYITTTRDVKMSENEAYEQPTSSNVTHTEPSVDYSYVNDDDEMIMSRDETKETSTQGGMKMSENVAYGHTSAESSHHGAGEGTILMTRLLDLDRRLHFRDCAEYYDEASQGSSKKNGETVLYIVPAKDENSLYAQLDGMKITSLTRDSTQITDFLGSGQFGTVHKGVWQSGDHEVEVAVKTLKEGSGEIDKIKFLQEAAIMGQFSHPNVVKLHGVITTREPIMIVLEFLSKGDLRNHLIGLKPQVGEDEHTLLSYCRQVASGMCYLANKAFVHRDLAARNILVAEDDVCKIADFGMSRDLEDETYYVSHGGRIPVK